MSHGPEKYVEPPEPPPGSPMPIQHWKSMLPQPWVCPECGETQETMYSDNASNLLSLSNHLLIHLIQRGR